MFVLPAYLRLYYFLLLETFLNLIKSTQFKAK